MSIPRRRVLRPARPAAAVHPRQHVLIDKRRSRLDRERAALTKWMTRLKRAFHAVEKQQRRVANLERQLVRLQQS